MIKNWGAAWALVALVASAGFALWLDFSAPYHRCYGVSNCNQAGQNKNRSTDYVASALAVGDFLDAHNGAVNALATLIIAAFTVVLAIRTGGLFKETAALRTLAAQQGEDMKRSLVLAEKSADAAHKSVDVARQTLFDVQRALIVPVNFQCDTLIFNGIIMGYRVSAIVENKGTTVAKRFGGIANFVILDSALPDDFTYADRSEGGFHRATIGPSVRTPQPIDIVLQDILDIGEKSKRGFFYGWIEYDDIFKATPRRRTEYCVEVEVVGDPRIINPGQSPLGFSVYGKYNGTDDDCFYKPGHRPPVGGLPPPTQPPQELIAAIKQREGRA